MARKAFSSYIPAADANPDLQACIDELQRELTVRKRIYDKWLSESRHTWSEGDQRMRAMMGALLFLNQCVAEDAQIKLDMANDPFADAK